LHDLGLPVGDEIDLLLITHPHLDHYGGAGRLVREHPVLQAVFAPFWNTFGMGSSMGYPQLVADLHRRGAKCQFLSGYARVYPDNVAAAPGPPGAGLAPGALCLEMLGPTNALVHSLEDQTQFDTNHLSIMSRISWGDIGVVIAADAQMENWAVFDNERMMKDGCDILRAAHHGSGNGTQWERLFRLKPDLTVVSSDLSVGHGLPDVTGAAVFARYTLANPILHPVALTGDSGTIEVVVDAVGAVDVHRFGEAHHQYVNLASSSTLDWRSNPTDWKRVLRVKARRL
jgi:competence protein ComEC